MCMNGGVFAMEIVLLGLLCVSSLASGFSDIDNGVVGTPVVECERDFVRFKIPTKKPFRGKVYVKGEYTNDNCIRSYSDGKSNSNGQESDESDSDPSLAQLRASEKRWQTSQKKPNGKDNLSGSQNRGADGFEDGEDEKSGEAEKQIFRKSTKTPNTFSPTNSAHSAKKHLENSQEGNSRQIASGEVNGEKGFESQAFSPSVTVFDANRRRVNNNDGGGKNKYKNNAHGARELERAILGASSTPDKSAPGNLPGFGTTQRNSANWHSFLRGRPDSSDGQNFRRYGSRMSPDANGECPLECPPCEECERKISALVAERRRRTAVSSSSRGKFNEYNEDVPTGRPYIYNSEVEGLNDKLNSQNMAELEVLLGTCNTRRDRMANPPGIHVSFTVVVSFHNNFITKVDRAYRVECAYEESDRTVTTQIDVSQPPSLDLSGVVESPQCVYLIRGSNGNATASDASVPFSITNVRVGDNVRHEWVCTRNSPAASGANAGDEDDEELFKVFGLLVHDCYVDDGRGRKESIVDSEGCSTSPLIMPTPTYSSNRLSASVDSLVAKFPDRDFLGFQCAITICMRELGNCDGVTPPNCAGNRTRRSIHVKQDGKSVATTADWQLHAPVLTVFDADEQHSSEFRTLLSSTLRRTAAGEEEDVDLLDAVHEVCVSITAFGILVAASTFLVTISSAVLFVVLFLNVQLHSGR